MICNILPLDNVYFDIIKSAFIIYIYTNSKSMFCINLGLCIDFSMIGTGQNDLLQFDKLKIYIHLNHPIIITSFKTSFANHKEWLHHVWGKMSAIIYDAEVLDGASDVLCTCWC